MSLKHIRTKLSKGYKLLHLPFVTVRLMQGIVHAPCVPPCVLDRLTCPFLSFWYVLEKSLSHTESAPQPPSLPSFLWIRVPNLWRSVVRTVSPSLRRKTRAKP